MDNLLLAFSDVQITAEGRLCAKCGHQQLIGSLLFAYQSANWIRLSQVPPSQIFQLPLSIHFWNARLAVGIIGKLDVVGDAGAKPGLLAKNLSMRSP